MVFFISNFPPKLPDIARQIKYLLPHTQKQNCRHCRYLKIKIQHTPRASTVGSTIHNQE
ncbi:hypothetical protein NEILACOT_03960 [Neisseria lactamica ATCC 23970]|uniref:Uncharacterized protein n=1 Tax=Neisseria lactamica ATCC 23970 TaxID=546265 RepID=D0W8V6_NEILA|nr:hypothetical protein NEILACOT_03960 [Neisseria lactamica ATCC 23970]